MKLKRSIKKKILTTLLIGASLSGISGKTAFADNKNTDLSRSELVSISSSGVKNLINEMNKNRASVVLYEVSGTSLIFVSSNNKLYLYDSNSGGGFRTGLVKVNGHIFLFNGTRYCSEVGWYNLKNYGRIYLDPYKYETPTDCFETIAGETFHFNNKGTVDIGLMQVNGNTYRFRNRTGVEVTGWWSEGPYRYLFENSGKAHTGWYIDGTAGNMYFDDRGRMVEGLQNLAEGTYYFGHHGNGANTYTIPGFYSDPNTLHRYYFDANDGNRAMKNKWFKTGPSIATGTGVMHFDNNGYMSDGVTEIDGNLYLFLHPANFRVKLNAYLTTGWYTDLYTHNTYYFREDNGQAARSISNTPVGAAVKGVQYIDGQRYVFDNNGVLIG